MIPSWALAHFSERPIALLQGPTTLPQAPATLPEAPMTRAERPPALLPTGQIAPIGHPAARVQAPPTTFAEPSASLGQHGPVPSSADAKTLKKGPISGKASTVPIDEPSKTAYVNQTIVEGPAGVFSQPTGTASEP